MKNHQRSDRIAKSYQGTDAIEASKRAHPDIRWRHLITESNDLRVNGLDELDFSPETTRPLIEIGKCDALKTILKTQNSNFSNEQL